MNNNENFLLVHHVILNSEANGPGNRTAVWLQGCSIRCFGCFNQTTHDFSKGTPYHVIDLYNRILDTPNIEGVTITGGEPLDQKYLLLRFLKLIRTTTSLSTILLTGYTWEEISNFPEAADLLSCCDVIIAGRFIQEKRVANRLIGSCNKTLHFITDRYNIEQFLHLQSAEIFINPDGSITVTGIDPPNILI